MAHDALRSRCVARRLPLGAEGLGPGSGAPRGWDAPPGSVRLSVTLHNEVHAHDSHLWISSPIACTWAGSTENPRSSRFAIRAAADAARYCASESARFVRRSA